MAVQFTAGYSLRASAMPAIGAGGCTIAGMVYIPAGSIASEPVLMYCGGIDNSNGMGMIVTPSGLIQGKLGGASYGSFTAPRGAWFHAALVYTGAAKLRMYLNGVFQNERDGTPVTPSGTYYIHRAEPAGVLISPAELGIWNAALTADQCLSLAKGATPPNIRPENLWAYLDFVRSVKDNCGRCGTLTVAARNYVDHPRIYP